MNHHAAIINNITIQNDVLQGTIFSPSLHQSFAIEIDPETAATDPADFDDLIKELQQLIEHLTPDRLREMEAAIASEITTSAYSQSDYAPTADDFTALEKDLKLMKITAFPEGFSLEYIAEANYPGNEIMVQLNRDFNMEDVAIYD